jgi:hypothetical protein
VDSGDLTSPCDVNQDFRFGPLSRASYASPALDNNEFAICGEPVVLSV